MTATQPLYSFTGTSTLRTSISKSVGPQRGTRSKTTEVMITVRATDQADAERVADTVLSTPVDTGDSRDGVRHRRTYTWEVITPCEPEPEPPAPSPARLDPDQENR